VIVALSDTHRDEGHGLSGRALAAVREADAVLHAGDFTSPEVLETFRGETGRVEAVHGNRDVPALRERLPATRTVELEGVRITLVHGHEHGETGLSLLGRESGADLVVFGHSHRPTIVDAEEITLLNPGSHADPRGNPAAHAELTATEAGLLVRLRTRDGDEIDAARIDSRT
jgi:putative phosphoesterase